MHYRFLIFFWMKSPCCWHTVWLLQCHIMKLLECADTISGVKFYIHKFFFFFCNSCRGLERPLGFTGGWGSQILRQSAHEGDQVVSPMHQLPLPQGDIPGNHFCYMLSLLQGQNVAGRITSMKTSDGTIGNRTCDLPACSSVPPPTVPPHAPQRHIIQFTFASTYYNMNICDTQKFSTRSELHNSKHRTHDVTRKSP